MEAAPNARACMLDYARQHWLPEPLFDQVLGKGHFGTAFATTDPKQVVKMTRDQDEGLLMAAQLEHNFAGIVPCRGALHVFGEHWMLWKAALDRVGYEAWFSKFADEADFLAESSDPATEWMQLTRWINASPRESGGAKSAAVKRLYQFAERWSPMRDICETCVYFVDSYGKVPDDMHVNNFGCWDDYDQMILFDAQMEAFSEAIDYASCTL